MIIKNKVITDIKVNTLKDLHKLKPLAEAGSLKLNKSQIARELGKDRRTVGKYIDGFTKSKHKIKSSKIDAFYSVIEELLSNENQQIFYYKRILWQYLKDNHSLDCAQSSFRRYISRKPEFDSYFMKRRKATIRDKAPMRFETVEGKQAQLDWKESIDYLTKDGEILVVNVFVLLLSYSRFRIYRLSLSKSQEILFSFIDDAFESFGGVPEEILTDNMKTVMDDARTKYKKGIINARFGQFASDYGFRVKPCIAGRPETKAKVEAPMKLLDEIRAYNGLLDYSELSQLVERMNNRINQEVHAGTGKIPILHFQKEKDSLCPLPKETIRKPYQINISTPKVNHSSMFTYLSNQYSVPPEYMGKRVNLQVYDDCLHVYYSRKLIAVHTLSRKKLNYLDDHYVHISSLTLRGSQETIREIARNNLKNIGAVYQHE
jgi:transposase